MVASDPDPASKAEAGAVPVTGSVATALNLGWQMQGLFGHLPERREPRRAAPNGLRGLSDLTRFQRCEGWLHAVTVSVDMLCGKDWPQTLARPNVNEVRAALTPFAAEDAEAPRGEKAEGAAVLQRRAAPAVTARQAQALRLAVSELHEQLMLTMVGVGPLEGTAYRLGRSLADTCRPSQSVAELKASFDPYRLGQLYAWLTDLASALPPHAARSVRLSLTWWRDTMFIDQVVASPQGRQLLNGLSTTAPGLLARQRRSRLTGRRPRKIAVTATTVLTPKAPDPIKYIAALARQGELWRSVLSGEKKATDLLAAADYIGAARSTLHTVWTLIRRPGAAIVIPALLLLLALGGGLLWVSHLNASGGSKIGGYLGIILAGLVAGVRAARPAATSLGTHLEGPLWGAEVDLAVSMALTIPPAGQADPTGWIAFVDRALKPSDAPPIHPPDAT